MRTDLLEQWHKNVINDFSDLGICYFQDSIPLNPLSLSSNQINKLSVDLPKIAKLCRRVALEQFDTAIENVRSDYSDAIKIYKDSFRLPIIMRPDGILIDGQLKLLEINIDSGIGGIWEMDFLQKRVESNPLLNEKEKSSFPNPKTAFLTFLDEIRQTIHCKGTPNLALVGYPDYNQFYKDQGEDLCESITENTDFNAYFKVPELLRKNGDYITDGVREYHVLYRDGALIHSATKVSPMLKLTKEAFQTKSIFLSDPIDLLVEHKGILAILHNLEYTNLLNITEEEFDLIESYVPWTHFVSDKKVSFEKSKSFISLFDLLLKQKDKFVLKKCWSHAGEHVYIGAELDMNVWKNLITSILNNPLEKWIAQENLYSDKFEFNYMLSNGEVVTKNQCFTLSPFIFGDKFGGAFVRVERDPLNRVLSLPTNNNMGAAGLIVL